MMKVQSNQTGRSPTTVATMIVVVIVVVVVAAMHPFGADAFAMSPTTIRVGHPSSTLGTKQGSSSSSSSSSSSALYVFGRGTVSKKGGRTKPTFDTKTEKWIPGPDDDGEYPYDAVGALLRHGPSPFIFRLTDPTGYEQAVLQFMSATGCSRSEATGNMDAKSANPADWAFRRLEEKKDPSKKVDYTVLKTKDAALTILWAVGITPLVVSSIVQTINQFGTGPSTIKYQ